MGRDDVTPMLRLLRPGLRGERLKGRPHFGSQGAAVRRSAYPPGARLAQAEYASCELTRSLSPSVQAQLLVATALALLAVTHVSSAAVAAPRGKSQ